MLPPSGRSPDGAPPNDQQLESSGSLRSRSVRHCGGALRDHRRWVQSSPVRQATGSAPRRTSPAAGSDHHRVESRQLRRWGAPRSGLPSYGSVDSAAGHRRGLPGARSRPNDEEPRLHQSRARQRISVRSARPRGRGLGCGRGCRHLPRRTNDPRPAPLAGTSQDRSGSTRPSYWCRHRPDRHGRVTSRARPPSPGPIPRGESGAAAEGHGLGWGIDRRTSHDGRRGSIARTGA